MADRDIQYGSDNGVPTAYDADTGKAWIIQEGQGVWIQAGTTDISDSSIMSKEAFDRRFPGVPPVPLPES